MWRFSRYYPNDTGGREDHSLSVRSTFILPPSVIPQRWKVIVTRLWQQQPLSAASSCSQLTAAEVMKAHSRLSTRSLSGDTGARAGWPSWLRGGAEHLRWPRCRGPQHFITDTLFVLDLIREHARPHPHSPAHPTRSTSPGGAVTFWWWKILKIHTVSPALWQLARSLAFKWEKDNTALGGVIPPSHGWQTERKTWIGVSESLAVFRNRGMQKVTSFSIFFYLNVIYGLLGESNFGKREQNIFCHHGEEIKKLLKLEVNLTQQIHMVAH